MSDKKEVTVVHDNEKPFITNAIPKFPDWPPGVRSANGTAPCH
jgi:hypothetical protein